MSVFLDFLNETFPPKPALTERELEDQNGKVFVVTGSTAGVGKELAGILYSKNARVYLAARSAEKAEKVIYTLKNKHPNSSGDLIFLQLDLNDLTTVKSAAEEFLSKENRLDILWNNAAILMPPAGSKSKQGYDKQLGVNALGPFLFTKLVTPLLVQTAKTSAPGSVRVIFVSSSATYLAAPKGGVDVGKLESRHPYGPGEMYGVSKAGDALYALHFAKLYGKDGVISASGNPGNLVSELQREFNWFSRFLMALISYEPVYGAYTELYGGFSPDITVENNGAWIRPWGRVGKLRQDILDGRSKEEGGTGNAEAFWNWSEDQIPPGSLETRLVESALTIFSTK